MDEFSSHSLNIDADRALFEGQISNLVLTFYENESPPCGLLGLLDWRFHGKISKFIRQGALSGQLGECSYLPFKKNDRVFHLLLIGAGAAQKPGLRLPLAKTALKVLEKNLSALKWSKIGVSKSDFGDVNSDFFIQNFKGVPLWITL